MNAALCLRALLQMFAFAWMFPQNYKNFKNKSSKFQAVI